MKKWKSTDDFAAEIVRADMVLTMGTVKNKITSPQAYIIAKSIVWCYVKGNSAHPPTAIHSFIRNGTPEVHLLFFDAQKDRMAIIYDQMFKYYWFPLSRIRRNVNRLCSE